MMRPARFFFIVGITARAQKNVPVRLVLSTRSHSSFFISATDEAGKIAASLIRTSMFLKARRVSATMASTDSSFETSVRSARAAPPAASMSLATRAPFSPLSSATTTFAPSSASPLASARPIPWPAPVTIATLFSNSFTSSLPCVFTGRRFRQGGMNVFRRDRPSEQARADGVRDGVGDRRRRAVVGELADRLRVERPDPAGGFQQHRLEPGDVLDPRQVVFTEIAVEHPPVLHHPLLHVPL